MLAACEKGSKSFKRNAERSEITRQEALRWLADLIRTPIGSVGKDSALVQAYEEDSAGNVKVRA
jgi:hypothetical protein